VLLTLRLTLVLLTLRLTLVLLTLRLTLVRAPRCPSSITPPASTNTAIAGTRPRLRNDPDIISLLLRDLTRRV
jgi:hypothetical protein